MGLFGDIANMAAKGAGISVRKARVKKEVEAQRLRAEDELQKHNAAYQKLLESERNKYLSGKEHYIVTYMFAQVMLGSNITQRNFTFLDQMPEVYRNGEEYTKNLTMVEDEYFSFLAKAFKDGEITTPSVISALKDLLYFPQLSEELKQWLAVGPFLENEREASVSVFTDCDDIDKMMQTIREYPFTDTIQTVDVFSKGITAEEDGNYKEAIKQWLFPGYGKKELDNIKIALLHFALDEEQDAATVEIYDAYQKICRRIFGFSMVKKENQEEKVVIYPPVDMVIAEVIRHIHSGTGDQYNNTLKDWLDTCGERVEYGQLNVMQNVFSYLKAFNQEAIILEYMVKNNMARTAVQDQRLKFLRNNQGGHAMSAPTFDAVKVESDGDNLLYDHRFINWKSNEIQQYFNNLTLLRKKQTFNMVVDEWQKDITVQGIHWNNEQPMQMITAETEKNFGDIYSVKVVPAGAAVDDWVDTIPSIYIRMKDMDGRNAELSFLVTGEQITNSTVHLSIMVLLAPVDSANNILENETLCKKVIAVKEKHNPRIDTYISTMKNTLIGQLENWINSINNNQEIY